MTLIPDGKKTGWQKTHEWWQLRDKKGGAIRDFSPAGRKVFGDQTNSSRSQKKTNQKTNTKGRRETRHSRELEVSPTCLLWTFILYIQGYFCSYVIVINYLPGC